ncbi:uncharacterized protein LOC106657060 [Trichogramma pretiosum]|uniref:uncharacterized protein LOC106657060 n=1 Tax=Trichogramma pretiosum TaxID=7493 RepID=UPI000C71ACE1|nr:uncharacterized protein LOC106657060 [Trichogramma pretiosum]XP_023318699.1 uncharacterized protein LOC106657060 [Trichogramma pretiosum]
MTTNDLQLGEDSAQRPQCQTIEEEEEEEKEKKANKKAIRKAKRKAAAKARKEEKKLKIKEEQERQLAEKRRIERLNLPHLQQLKKLRLFDWRNEERRYRMFHDLLVYLCQFWVGPAPNLREIFSTEEMDWLLLQAVEPESHMYPVGWRKIVKRAGPVLVEFAFNSGYRDDREPSEPFETRVTAIHHEARLMNPRVRNRNIMPMLFRIYDRFDVNYRDEAGFTHMHAACQAALDNVVRKFLDAGHDPNLPVPDTGNTPLHLAVHWGCTTLVKTLLQRGANPNLANRQGLTPLHLICENESKNGYRMARYLFEFARDEYRPLLVNCRDELMGRTPLHVALRHGKLRLVALLLNEGARAYLLNQEATTPLHVICDRPNDFVELAELFFKIYDRRRRKQVRDANEQDDDGIFSQNDDDDDDASVQHDESDESVPVDDAENLPKVQDDENELEKLLLADDETLQKVQLDAMWVHVDDLIPVQHDDENEKSTQFGKIEKSIQVGHVEVQVDMIQRPLMYVELEESLEVDESEKKSKRRRTRASRSKPTLKNKTTQKGEKSPLVETIDASTQVDEIAKPAQIVRIDASTQVDDIELSVVAQINAEDEQGRTPLRLALRRGNAKLVEFLLRRGADLVRASERPLHLALRRGSPELTEFLLRRGDVDPNLADDEGRTPLHVICERLDDWDDLMKLFFRVNDELGRLIKLDEKDEWGLTPLQVAVANLRPDLVELLLDRGADIDRFAFPTEDHFGVEYDLSSNERSGYFGIRLAAGAIGVVECLEKRMKLPKRGIATIMQFFADNDLLQSWADLDGEATWRQDACFLDAVKSIPMTPSLSLYELLDKRPEELTAEGVTYREHIELEKRMRQERERSLRPIRKKKKEAAVLSPLLALPERYSQTCVRLLAEQVSRGFFLRHARDTRYARENEQLVEQLMNRYLHHVWLTADQDPRLRYRYRVKQRPEEDTCEPCATMEKLEDVECSKKKANLNYADSIVVLRDHKDSGLFDSLAVTRGRKDSSLADSIAVVKEHKDSGRFELLAVTRGRDSKLVDSIVIMEEGEDFLVDIKELKGPSRAESIVGAVKRKDSGLPESIAGFKERKNSGLAESLVGGAKERKDSGLADSLVDGETQLW